MGKPYKPRNGPNRLLDVKIWHLAEARTLGVVALDTDHGVMEFAVNQTVAQMLIDELQAFLNDELEDFPKD